MELRDKVAALPLLPGVYLYKDQFGTVIYVGQGEEPAGKGAQLLQ